MSKNLKAPRTRLYVESSLQEGIHLELEANHAHYLGQVLRLKAGDKISLFNGKDGSYLAEIRDIHKKYVQLVLHHQLNPQRNSPDVWLLSAPLKHVKSEWLVEKATELGISCFIPVKTQHTIVDKVNETRMKLAAIAASEQCERLDIPVIKTMLPLTTLLSQWDSERTLIYADESGKGEEAGKALKGLAAKKYAVLVGCEGGFSKEELKMLESLSFAIAITMGPRIMRADTATIAALSLVQSHIGDWNDKPQFRSE